MTWLQPLMQNIGENTLADPVYPTIDFINLDDLPTDTGEILFGDMIDAEVDEEDEAPPPQDSEPLTLQDISAHAIELKWELPVSLDLHFNFPVSTISTHLGFSCPGQDSR